MDEDDFQLVALPKIKKERKNTEGQWSDKTKYNVCKALLFYPNNRLVSEATGVPLHTIQSWKNAEWWASLVDELKKEHKAILSNKMATIVDKALYEVKDRLDNGDVVLNQKTGELVRKPVTVRDATRIVNDFVDQQIKIEKSNETNSVEQVTVQDALKLLAQEFAKFNKKAKTENVVDVDFKEIPSALYEERKEGLNETT